jgi:hypothetical protein
MRRSELKPLCSKGWLANTSAGYLQVTVSVVKKTPEHFSGGLFSYCPDFNV